MKDERCRPFIVVEDVPTSRENVVDGELGQERLRIALRTIDKFSTIAVLDVERAERQVDITLRLGLHYVFAP